MKHYALIVAGGSGTRMGAALPKQFLLLRQKPVLMHTLAQFAQCPSKPEIILVLPESSLPIWETLIKEYRFSIPHLLVAGGLTRIDSVRNGLATITELDSLVAIHDGVRPLITTDIIENSYAVAKEKGSAVACVALKDSIRYIDAHGTKTVDRQHYQLVQTPQTFLASLIKNAYQMPDIHHLTDDASVLEAAGKAITIIEGSYQNLKITTPEDMQIAEALMPHRT